MEVKNSTSVSEHWNRFQRHLLAAFSHHTHVTGGERYEVLASQLQLICRYSIDIAPSHHAGLLSSPSDPYLLTVKHTTLGHHSRPSVSTDPCNTAFIKLLTLNMPDNPKLAVFENQISL